MNKSTKITKPTTWHENSEDKDRVMEESLPDKDKLEATTWREILEDI